MICIRINNLNPFFSLAAEEYFLKNFDEDVFLLWQSENTVVVGKHQNAMAEINYRYLRENNIFLARRISGGGTVFHDSGNVNFAFIKNVKSPAEISFQKFTRPIVNALKKLGVEATTSGRNDLLVNGLKISGNAEHVFKNRVLHHGTLLFNSNLKNLGEAIKVSPGKYAGKAVQSNRSNVANISNFLTEKISTETFIGFLYDFEMENKQSKKYVLNSKDEEEIKKLVVDKFSTWDWNFGYSPKYSFQNTLKSAEKTLNVQLIINKGKVTECDISGNWFSAGNNKKLAALLLEKRHCFDDVNPVLQNFETTNLNEIIYSFF